MPAAQSNSARRTLPPQTSAARKRKSKVDVVTLTMRRIERERKLAQKSEFVVPAGPGLTLKQSSKRTGYSVRTLRRMVLGGQVSYYRDGIQIRIVETELERIMSQRMIFVAATAPVEV